MKHKRLSIPLQVETCRRPHRQRRWLWVLTVGLVTLLLIWLMSRSPGEFSPRPAVPTAEVLVELEEGWERERMKKGEVEEVRVEER